MRDTTPQAVQICHELLLWLIPQLDKFPRSRRFTLGERLETALLEVLERLVEAAYSQANAKRPMLASANRRLEMARHLWRLSHEGNRYWDRLGLTCGLPKVLSLFICGLFFLESLGIWPEN